MIIKQGKNELVDERDSVEEKVSYCRELIGDLCNMKNINFLFGSGVSSGAIPTMKEMAARVDEEVNEYVFKDEVEALFEETDSENSLREIYKKIKKQKEDNLEEILGVLYSKVAYDEGVGEKTKITELVELIEKVIFEEINVDLTNEKSFETLSLYKVFYRKISNRGKELPRLNVFTTNNDLFNEAALDQLNIDYNNGFGGGLKKLFNPSRFSYSFSKNSDTMPDKFESLGNMVYLYKMHGSINWKESESASYFLNIEEVKIDKESRNEKATLVYPTPLKQNKSLGSPYADIMREFKVKLSLPNNVLFVIGYSFSDEHVNNLIYHALSSNDSLSVIVFGCYEDKPIFQVGDDRVYSIYGNVDSAKAHYFDYIVNSLLPDLNKDKTQEILKDFSDNLRKLMGAEK